MPSELAVAVKRQSARIVGCDGSASQVVLFLHSTSSRGPRPETVGERLNALEGEFLPCELDGGVVLLNLQWVAYVECPEGGCDESAEGERKVRVELDLVSGETLSGELHFAARPGRARVSDLLNSSSERFVHLTAGAVHRYVRRESIVRVRT